MIGTVFSGYRLQEKLGGGNTGVVYKAFDLKKQRWAAVKILTNDFLMTKEKKARFMRETQAAAMLEHPALTRIFEAGEASSCYFLAMEYIAGETFGDIIEKHPDGVPLERFFKLMLPVVDGLAMVHENNLAHRDIKPSNLKYAVDAGPKILDFGLVKFLNQQSGDDSFNTISGMVVGSAGYMSPEQAGGNPLDARTDIFNLGILMYELLTGKNPFHANNVFATISKIMHSDPLSIELLRPELPMALAEAIFKCLKKDMGDRFSNARELHRQIASI